MLSDRTQYPSESVRSASRQKALAVLEMLDSIRSGNFSKRLADEIKQTFVSDPDTKNLQLAKRFLTQLRSACDAVTDEDYAEFLNGFISSEDIADAVARSRQNSNGVAAHIQALLDEVQ